MWGINEYGVMRTECPKCGSSNAKFYLENSVDVALKCLCGFYKVVQTTLEKIVITHQEVLVVKIPKEGSHLWKTLMVLSVMEPANSSQISICLGDLGEGYSVSDVSTYLTFLKNKGLISQLNKKRGVVGGSTWVITEKCRILIK